MALDLSLFNGSVSTLLDHLTRHYGEDAKLETYVICARVRSATIPGGSETPVLYPGCPCCQRKSSREENLR
jgi:hypothetical protein